MTQTILSFIQTRSRRTDPSTSREAAKHAASTKAQDERIAIREALVRLGPMDPLQIARVTGIEYHEVNRRMSEIHGIRRNGNKIDKRSVWESFS
jgi:hypothetical protein